MPRTGDGNESVAAIDSPMSVKSKDSMSSVQCQKQMRLRVNRVAIIQALEVEHVLPYLSMQNVLTAEEVRFIEQGFVPQDKARRLIDLLPSKLKTCDWYMHFREALKSPSTDNTSAKKRYQILVEFLDNTIIKYNPKITPKVKTFEKKSKKNVTYPRYQPLPHITDGYQQSDLEIEKHEDAKKQQRENMSKKYIDHIKNFRQQSISAPHNFTSKFEEYNDSFSDLSVSQKSNEEEFNWVEQEKEVLKKVQDLEIVFSLSHKDRCDLPEGFQLSMSKAVYDVLQDRNQYHCYFKYLNIMKEEYYMDILSEIAISFGQLVSTIGTAEDSGIREEVITTAFGLFDFLKDYGYYWRAEWLLRSVLMPYLESWSHIETWMPTWKAHIKLMSINNMNYQFKLANNDYNAAMRLATKIKMMSFGRDLLDESEMLMELSIMMREQGSEGPSISWAQAAIKEVEGSNHRAIIDVLCNATEAYSAKGNVKKASQLAVASVQQARKLFGTCHPLYVKSLMNYCSFSNEYIQDDMGIEVAKKALEIAENLYQTDSIVVAHAHRTLSVGLLVSKHPDSGVVLFHAVKALRIAQDVIPGSHPVLAAFKYTLAMSLFNKAGCEKEAERERWLRWAGQEARASLSVFESFFGQYSLRAAQAHSLLGQVHMLMESYDEAEKSFKESWTVHELCMAPRGYHTLHFKSVLAAFFEKVNKTDKAVEQLKDVVEMADIVTVNPRWLIDTYNQLIDVLRKDEKTQEADDYKQHLADLVVPDYTATWCQLNEQQHDYKDFIQNFNIWSRKFNIKSDALKNVFK